MWLILIILWAIYYKESYIFSYRKNPNFSCRYYLNFLMNKYDRHYWALIEGLQTPYYYYYKNFTDIFRDIKKQLHYYKQANIIENFTDIFRDMIKSNFIITSKQTSLIIKVKVKIISSLPSFFSCPMIAMIMLPTHCVVNQTPWSDYDYTSKRVRVLMASW